MSRARSVVVFCLVVAACFLAGRIWADCTWQDCHVTQCIYFGNDPQLGNASCATFDNPQAFCMYSVAVEGGPMQEDPNLFTVGQLWTQCAAGSCTNTPNDGSKNQNSVPNGMPFTPHLQRCLGGSGCGYPHQ
jgi:hypothetical protein